MTRSSTPANALEWANKIWTVSLENSPRFWTATEKLLQSLLSNEGELVDPDNAESTVSALGMKFKQVVELFVRAQPILDYLLVELQKKTNMEGPPSAHHSIHVSQMYKQPPQVGNPERSSQLLSQLQFTSPTAKDKVEVALYRLEKIAQFFQFSFKANALFRCYEPDEHGNIELTTPEQRQTMDNNLHIHENISTLLTSAEQISIPSSATKAKRKLLLGDNAEGPKMKAKARKTMFDKKTKNNLPPPMPTLVEHNASDCESKPDSPSAASADNPSANKENNCKKNSKKAWKTVGDIPDGGVYFQCPAPGCDKVSLWSFKREDIQMALQQGMDLLPPDANGRRQINNNVPQRIKCLSRPGYTGMKEHLKTCEKWKAQVGETLLGGEKGNNKKFASLPVDLVPPLYRDRRVVMKKDGLHKLTRAEKKKRENDRQKDDRRCVKIMLDKLVKHWNDDVENVLRSIGITRELIPRVGFRHKDEVLHETPDDQDEGVDHEQTPQGN